MTNRVLGNVLEKTSDVERNVSVRTTGGCQSKTALRTASPDVFQQTPFVTGSVLKAPSNVARSAGQQSMRICIGTAETDAFPSIHLARARVHQDTASLVGERDVRKEK